MFTIQELKAPTLFLKMLFGWSAELDVLEGILYTELPSLRYLNTIFFAQGVDRREISLPPGFIQTHSKLS
jgi:hypothetical protein